MELFNALKVLNKLKNYPEWLFEQYADRLYGDVLDIGSGMGDLVQFYGASKIQTLTATDCADEMLVHLRSRFGGLSGFKVARLDIMSAQDVQGLGVLRFDVVSCINVLEHVPDDLKALRHMYDLLRPGGVVCVIVPALDWLHSSLDDLVGHERRYSRRTIFPRLTAAGFEKISFSYMNMLGVITWFLAFRVFRRKSFPAKACERLDRMVPFLKKVDRLFRPSFGQSLVVFAYKPR